MYKVIYGFIDAVEDRNYREGDTFVVGEKTDEKRLALLSGSDNNIGRPLIEQIEDAPIEDAPVEDAPVEDEAPTEEPAEEPAEVPTEAEPEVVAPKPANKSKSASKGE